MMIINNNLAYLFECLFYGKCLTCGKNMSKLNDNHKCYYVLEKKLNNNLISIITEYNKVKIDKTYLI